MIMEYVDGDSLHKFLSGRTLKNDLPAVKTVFKQLAEAVCHIHRMGIVHRDIKTENIMIEVVNRSLTQEEQKSNPAPAGLEMKREYRVKLIDFGLSSVLGL